MEDREGRGVTDPERGTVAEGDGGADADGAVAGVAAGDGGAGVRVAAGDGGAGARIAPRDAGVDAGRILNRLSGCGDWAGTRARCGGDENGWILVAHACTLLPS